jgi:hypothetical protein
MNTGEAEQRIGQYLHDRHEEGIGIPNQVAHIVNPVSGPHSFILSAFITVMRQQHPSSVVPSFFSSFYSL